MARSLWLNWALGPWGCLCTWDCTFHCSRLYKSAIWDLGASHWRFMQKNSTSIEMLFLSSPNWNRIIAAKFCTCTATLASAKLYVDFISKNVCTTEQNFQIWSVNEKLLVRWTVYYQSPILTQWSMGKVIVILKKNGSNPSNNTHNKTKFSSNVSVWSETLHHGVIISPYIDCVR